MDNENHKKPGIILQSLVMGTTAVILVLVPMALFVIGS